MKSKKPLHRWISGLALFFLLGVHSLFAAHRVVLLTSIDEPDSVLSRLENVFERSYAGSGYDVVIRHRADEMTLRKYLTSPDVVGLFWLSHAGADRKVVSALDGVSTILDIDHNNVKDLFTTIDPHIRFIGLVGCDGKAIVDDFQRRGYFAKNPSLQFWAYDRPVDAYQGLEKMIDASATFLGDPKLSQGSRIIARQDLLDSPHGSTPVVGRRNDPYFLTFRITRQAPPGIESGLGEARVELGDRVLTILPALQTGEKQEVEVSLSWESLLRERDFNIQVYQDLKGFPDALPIGMPEITDQSRHLHWKPFVTESGAPVGISQHLYLAPRQLVERFPGP